MRDYVADLDTSRTTLVLTLKGKIAMPNPALKANQNALLSLAVLKVNIDEEESDYLGYLERFAIFVLDKYHPDLVTDEKLANLFEKEFDLRLPVQGAQMLLRRLAKRRFIRKNRGIYSIVNEFPELDIIEKRRSAKRHIDEIYMDLAKYAKSEFGRSWNEATITETVLNFLNHFAIDYIKAYEHRTAIPELKLSAPESHIIISKYVKHLHETHNALFDSFIVLVKGQLYANSIVCPDIDSLQKNFKRVTFYVDTPVLLNALLLQENEYYEATTGLFNLITKLQGKLAVFSHTVEETLNVLDHARHNLNNPRATGKMVTEFRHSGKKKGDLDLVIGRFDNFLSNLKIIERPTPPYRNEYQIDEAAFEKLVSDRIKYLGQNALKNDINSIRSIYVLRGNNAPRRLEDAKAVFLTNNQALAEAAFEFGKGHNSTKDVSSIITDYSLANIAWLKAPLEAPDLPRKETLATCFAALEPNKDLWDKYLHAADQLESEGIISPDDHAILRVSGIAKDELMNLTLGNDSDVNQESIMKVLERVKRELSIESQITINKKQNELQETRTKLTEAEEQNEYSNNRIRRACDKAATVIGILVLSPLIASVLTACIYAFVPQLLFSSAFSAVEALIYIAIVIGLLLGALGTITGVPVIRFYANIKAKVSGYLYKKVSSYLTKKNT